RVADLTMEAGLQVTSYGSYYKVGHKDRAYSFADILKTSEALKAPYIRVWAGNRGSHEADAAYRKQVADDLSRIADMAQERHISIHLEYHGGTLTDTPESAAQLLRDTANQNAFTYWQPAVSAAVEDRLESIRTIQPWLSHVHVFHWQGRDRRPFKEGLNEWKRYLDALPFPDETRYLLMEFVKDDSLEQFFEDAKAFTHLVHTKSDE